MKRWMLMVVGLAFLGLVGWGPVANAGEKGDTEKPVRLKWAQLMPEDFHPEKLFDGMDIAMLDDSNPKVQKLMERYMAEIKRAPTNPKLAGRLVKIPGYVAPLEMDGEVASEFLLVPYFGACIHVPPPPANQVVHVRAVGKGTKAARSWYDTVWVIGRMRIEHFEGETGTAAYAIDAQRIEPYEEQE